jgi:hypothetical protein
MSTPASQDKRLHLTAATVLLVAAGKKFGVEFSESELLFIGTLVAAYIGQSQFGAVKKAQAAGQTAADAVKTPADADAALGVKP